jgi:PleD family two-component response regulator
MHRGTILLIESDEQLRLRLGKILSDFRFNVITCTTGAEAKAEIARMLPHCVVLSCDLSDADGYDLLREWRTTTRTGHIAVLLTQRDATHEHKIKGLELGADDFINKPIHEEEFLLRVINSVSGGVSQRRYKDALTGLPKGGGTEDHIRELLFLERYDWVYVDMKIRYFEPFSDVYGWQKADELLKDLAEQFKTIVKQFGTDEDFIGHPGRDMFVVITHSESYEQVIDKLAAKINETVIQYYSQEDRERGYIVSDSHQVPLMTLTWGMWDVRKTRPQDIRELTELAMQDRLKKYPNYKPDESPDHDILTAW